MIIFESTFNIFEIVKKDLKLNSKLEKDLKCLKKKKYTLIENGNKTNLENEI
ncbi:hypothetical protein PCS8106_00377 [Streptococcus pneumoniae PCS8106]|nr:hypothetical protein PCS8106_00377 [Streptococcus pneumoniae PCS8106]